MTKPTLKPIIAIDGPAGSGKSTLARALAKKLHLLYIDSGAMYRAVALKATRLELKSTDAEAFAKIARESEIKLDHYKVFLDGEEVENKIRTPEISRLTSQVVANIKGVREALVAHQQALGSHGGVVMEGRDIGTVVFPKADLKVYFDVSVEERTRRRVKDFKEREIDFDEKQVRQDIERRDVEDKGRSWGALKQAEDAVLIHGDGKTVDQLLEEIFGHLKARGLAH